MSCNGSSSFTAAYVESLSLRNRWSIDSLGWRMLLQWSPREFPFSDCHQPSLFKHLTQGRYRDQHRFDSKSRVLRCDNDVYWMAVIKLSWLHLGFWHEFPFFLLINRCSIDSLGWRMLLQQSPRECSFSDSHRPSFFTNLTQGRYRNQRR